MINMIHDTFNYYCHAIKYLPSCNSIYNASIITCIGTSQSGPFDNQTCFNVSPDLSSSPRIA